jgi:uncharacterized protein DUF4114
MKTFGIIGAGLLMTIAAMADTISSTGSLVGVPGNFQSTTATSSTPFWNNYSNDGANMNVGDFLTGSNPAMSNVNYLAPGLGDYLSTGGAGPDSPNFTFLQSAVTVQGTLLYTNAPSNYTYDFPGFAGTQIGFYNAADPSQNEVLFASGTLYNTAAGNGIFNTPQSPVTLNTWANYGIYAYTCWFNRSTFQPDCNMFYSNAALNTSGTNKQHFALFENPQSPNTFYIGFEDGVNGNEGYGDFNDVIFKLQTTQNPNNGLGITSEVPPAVTPEPATFSVLGIGLVTLGLFRRRTAVNR